MSLESFIALVTILAILAIAWRRWNVLDNIGMLPNPHRHILTNMPNGFIVLDAHRNIQMINPIMGDILGVSEKAVIGQPIHSQTKFYSILTYAIAEGGTAEISWEDQHYTLIISDLPQKRTLIVLERITQQKELQEKLRQQLTQLEIVHQMNEEISSTLSIKPILNLSLDAIMRISNAKHGFIVLIDEDNRTNVIQEATINYPQVKLDTAIIKRVLNNQKSELINDVQSELDYTSLISTTRAMMVFPLIAKDKVIGIVNLETPSPAYFTATTFQFVQILIDRIAVTLDNAQLYKRAELQYDELQKTHKKVSELESLKTDMIRLAAHDLRNPLSVINGYATLIQSKKNLVDEKLHPIFDKIADSTSRMESIIENFLSIERIESLNEEVTFDTFDFARDVTRAFKEYAHQIPEDAQTMSLEKTVERVLVYGDRPQIYEAIVNLISNAIKYTPPEGSITVRLDAEDNYIVYRVVDTGYGVPEELQATLFEPFSRIKTEETHGIVGMGLGLHLVKNIVERSGGEVVFHSVYGNGSTFGFKLPIAMLPKSTQELPVVEVTSTNPSEIHK